MESWIGGSGIVLICLLTCLIIFDVGSNDPMGAFWVVSVDDTCVGQGVIDLCPHMGTETGATDRVCLGKVCGIIPLGS